MPRVVFTDNLKRHVEAPERTVAATSVREALDIALGANPRLRGYILDDQGRPRKHIAVFVNGKPVRDREGLSDPVDDSCEVFVMQALSGG